MLTLRTKIAFFTEALVGSNTDASMTTRWLAFCWEKKNSKNIALSFSMSESSIHEKKNTEEMEGKKEEDGNNTSTNRKEGS